jgi:hypothetical protein
MLKPPTEIPPRPAANKIEPVTTVPVRATYLSISEINDPSDSKQNPTRKGLNTMNPKSLKSLLLSLALLLNVYALPVLAEPIDAKVEQQGKSSYVKITGLKTAVRDGILALQIELANSDYKPRKIYYRLKWLDDSGFQVWDDEPWKPVLVQGSARQNLQVSSPTVKARDFRIQFNAEDNRPTDPTEPNN